MQKVFYLKSCSTCLRIMKRFDLSGWELRELKSAPLTAEELEILHARTGSYESFFSKRSAQIRARNIDLKTLTETDFKALLLDHYSFLKRPVFITDDHLFIGNDHHTLENLDEYFAGR